MQLGMIGLGRMGANMVRRLMRGGHSCVVHDVSADAVRGLAGEGAVAFGEEAEAVVALAVVELLVERPAAAEHVVENVRGHAPRGPDQTRRRPTLPRHRNREK